MSINRNPCWNVSVDKYHISLSLTLLYSKITRILHTFRARAHCRTGQAVLMVYFSPLWHGSGQLRLLSRSTIATLCSTVAKSRFEFQGKKWTEERMSRRRYGLQLLRLCATVHEQSRSRSPGLFVGQTRECIELAQLPIEPNAGQLLPHVHTRSSRPHHRCW
jgi:hypothetical protein